MVWLNEAPHYLGESVHGERVAAAIHRLLTAPDHAPVLVLGTLWPEYAHRYTALPAAYEPDPHSRTPPELLGGRRITVPDTFDAAALAAARSKADAGDGLLAGVLARASGHGRHAQDLAGAPELLKRYEEGTPGARAILAVRFGHGSGRAPPIRPARGGAVGFGDAVTAAADGQVRLCSPWPTCPAATPTPACPSRSKSA